MEAHEIIAQVHTAFPKLPAKVARIKGVSDEVIRSHHREPKTINPESSGNASPVTHYIRYCHENEAAVRGAGRMLNNRVHASLAADFDDEDGMSQMELHTGIIDENCDVQKWLAQFDLDKATPRQLAGFEQELMENIEALTETLGKARRIRRLREAGIEPIGRAA